MKNKITLLVIGTILVLIVLLLLTIRASSNDRPFNKVELSGNNLITNSTNTAYLDTIVSVGLDEVGIVGNVVSINELSDAAKMNFNGGLKAHLRYFNGMYYLFIDEMDRQKAITVIAHEIVHIMQYNSGTFVYDEYGKIIWMGTESSLDEYEYDQRPWEIEAYQKETELASKIYKILY